MNSRDLLKNALRGGVNDRPPIWLMRQAGRYMAAYRELRKRHSFMELCHNPDLATEITLQPVRAFGMDAAIFFCDILVTAEALGGDLDIVEKVGPVIANPVRTQKDLDRLIPQEDALASLQYTHDALTQIRATLPADKGLLGFAGAPLTVASYMIEGGSSSQVPTVFRMIQEDPQLFSNIMTRLTDLTIAYVALQRSAGVDGIQIFESWASLLPMDIYVKHVLPHLQRLMSACHLPDQPDQPLIMFALAQEPLWDHLAALPADVISLGPGHDPKAFRQKFPNKAIQGNLDSRYMLGDQKIMLNAATELLEKMRGEPGYVFNLGHGLTPKTPESNVQALVDLVQNWR
jgi:uroporphyrinogen decarboxylase